MITGAVSALPTPIQNYYPSTYITGGGSSGSPSGSSSFSGGSTQGLADAVGRTTSALSTRIDNLLASPSISGLLSAVNGSFSGDLSVAGSLTVSGSQSLSGALGASYFTASDASATTTFAGGLQAGGASGLYVLQNGFVGIGTTSPSQLLTVGNNNKFAVDSSGDIWSGGNDIISPTGGAYGMTDIKMGLQVESAGNSPSLILNSATVRAGYQAFVVTPGVFGAIMAPIFQIIANGNVAIGASWAVPASGLNVLSNAAIGYAAGIAAPANGMVIAGKVGIGTTTPQYLLNPFSSTASQLALSAGAGVSQWAFRNAGGNFYFATTTVAGTATTTTSALTILNNGNVGIGTTAPTSLLSVAGTSLFTGRMVLGTNAPTTDDTAILVARAATNPLSLGGSHAFRDESTYSAVGTGGYASYDSIPVMSGSIAYSHLHSFQARPNYSGSLSVDEVAGSTMQAALTGTGTTGLVVGLRMMDSQGTGPVTTQTGIQCDPMTRGTSNYCMYSGSTSVTSYHGGLFQFGTAPKISAAGFSTYGEILGTDASGNILSNPNLTIVNGVLTMAYSTAKVLASATNLQLESTSGNVLIRPGAATTATFLSTGNVGIGTTTPWKALSVNGGVAMPALSNGSTGYYACVNTTTGELSTSATACGASSIKYKENVQPLSYGLNEVLALNPVFFNYKSSYVGDSRRQVGFIAEEVATVTPELVAYDNNGEIQGLDYPKFTSILVKAIQELNKKFDSLKNLVLDSLTSTTIYTRDINADKLCLGATCITETELKTILDNNKIVNISSTIAGTSTTPTDTTVVSTTTATTTPTIEESNNENSSATSTPSI